MRPGVEPCIGANAGFEGMETGSSPDFSILASTGMTLHLLNLRRLQSEIARFGWNTARRAARMTARQDNTALSMDLKHLIQLLTLAAIWGSSFLFMRIGVPLFGPAYLIALRVLIAAAVLCLFGLWLRKPLGLRSHWRHYLIIGFMNSALPFLLFAYAAQSLSASLLSILNATSALWGAVIAALWLRVPITRSIALGLCFGLFGVVLLVGNGVALSGDAGWLPVAAGLIAPICYAIASTYTKARPSTTTPFANTQGSMWMAGLVCLPVLLLVPIRQTPHMGDWAALAALGVFCTGIAYLMYFRLIQDVGPAKALSVTFLIPVFGVLWGALFLDEAVGWDKLTGGVLVLAGISLTTGIVKLPSRQNT